MRALIVLVLVSLVAAGLALVAPEYRDSCYTDQQCKQQLGPDCVCLRAPQQSKSQPSRCYCNSNKGFFYGCNEDFECQYLGKPHQRCHCAKSDKGKGHCKCLDPLH